MMCPFDAFVDCSEQPLAHGSMGRHWSAPSGCVLRIVNQAELPEELELVEIRALGLAADEAC